MPQGLTDAQVQEKIRQGKVNKISHNTKSIREILLTNIFTPFNIFYFFIIAIVLAFYFGTHEEKLLLDGWGIISIVLVNTLIAIVQELRAKKMLEKVQLLIKKEVTVVRNGEKKTIYLDHLVHEDTVFVERGDQIPADGKVLESTRLEIDESLLTGESEAIIKKKDDQVLSGSFIVSGNGYFVVEKLGNDSYAGKITGIAKNFKYIVSPLQKKIIKIIQILSFVAVFLIILRVFGNIERGIFNIDSVRQYLTIIISLIPHGLVFLTTVTYILGVYRISQIGAIVQKINAIEAFSGINIVCTDKTGTLTQNKLSVTNFINTSDLPNSQVENLVALYAKYSSYKNSTLNALAYFSTNDDAEVLDELPFSSETKRSAIKISYLGKERTFLLGGYDILGKNVDPALLSKVNNDEIKYFRNLIFIEVISTESDLSKAVETGKLVPLAVVSIVDTIRTDSIEAIRLFESKNIDIKILSGDSAFAIQAIAQKVGWNITDDQLISGPELKELDSNKFNEVIKQKKIFARLEPAQKRKIITAFKSMGLYTAMIGDGVNDLPAIKKAHLGIAMEEGSQVTKEVADIVLVQNKFSLLPEIFDEGNKIVNSIRMAAKLFLTKNLFVTLMVLISVIGIAPFILTPRNVSFLNIFIITLPSVLISLYNKDIIQKRYFLKDLLTTVMISSVFAVAFSYLAFFIVPNFFPNISPNERLMIYVCVIAFIALSNFMSVVIPSHEDLKSKIIFVSYSLGLIFLLFLATTINLRGTILGWFQDLYEVYPLKTDHWLFILAIGITGGLILYGVQKLRKIFIEVE